ncbi:MAG: hydroxyacylglutathione hydrolase [Syntrophorhabdus sp. PtaU1.Bin153]|nr:MAG: hydroxyacylglutathione hydrolase [Syntrophorhabdus sp. PtaU1.Bin153]
MTAWASDIINAWGRMRYGVFPREACLVFNKTGLVRDDLYVAGLAWSPVYLLAIREPVLFEAGFHCVGPIYEEAIRNVVDGRVPKTLFLTHVHWDHCGAALYLKKVFPGLRVAGSGRSAEIMKRCNAQALIRQLSRNVIPLVAGIDGIDESRLIVYPFEPFEFDFILEDGQTIELEDGLTIRVIATPGHTRDLMSYYIPEKRILIATEAGGIRDQAGQIITEFLVDYDMYVESLKRLAALDVDIFCQGHHFVFVGDDVGSFFARSLKAAEEFRNDVEILLDVEGGSVERVVQRIKAKQYDTNTGVKQSEEAYLLNLTARVAHLAERASKT